MLRRDGLVNPERDATVTKDHGRRSETTMTRNPTRLRDSDQAFKVKKIFEPSEMRLMTPADLMMMISMSLQA